MPDARPKTIALVPARGGSQRVKKKNIRTLASHPLIAYAINAALDSGIFERVVVSTDCEQTREIAQYYGAECPFLRPPEYATATSPDIEWITHALNEIGDEYDCFAIVRPTSPFRGASTIVRAFAQFLDTPGADSIRAVELCKQHPGKMWIIEGGFMHTLLDQSHLEVAWHAGQYQALPKVYVQNSSLEIAWTKVVRETNTREGDRIAPFVTEGIEGFTIDYEDDWVLAQHYINTQGAQLPAVKQRPFAGAAGTAG